MEPLLEVIMFLKEAHEIFAEIEFIFPCAMTWDKKRVKVEWIIFVCCDEIRHEPKKLENFENAKLIVFCGLIRGEGECWFFKHKNCIEMFIGGIHMCGKKAIFICVFWQCRFLLWVGE